MQQPQQPNFPQRRPAGYQRQMQPQQGYQQPGHQPYTPYPQQSSGNGKWIAIGIGGGIFCLGLVVVLIVVLMGKGEPTHAPNDVEHSQAGATPSQSVQEEIGRRTLVHDDAETWDRHEFGVMRYVLWRLREIHVNTYTLRQQWYVARFKDNEDPMWNREQEFVDLVNKRYESELEDLRQMLRTEAFKESVRETMWLEGKPDLDSKPAARIVFDEARELIDDDIPLNVRLLEERGKVIEIPRDIE